MNAIIAELVVSAIAMTVLLVTLPVGRELQRVLDSSRSARRISTISEKASTKVDHDDQRLARLVFGGTNLGIIWIGFAASVRRFSPSAAEITLMSTIGLLASSILVGLVRALYSDSHAEATSPRAISPTRRRRASITALGVVALLAFGLAATLVGLWHRMGPLAIPISLALGGSLVAGAGALYVQVRRPSRPGSRASRT